MILMKAMKNIEIGINISLTSHRQSIENKDMQSKFKCLEFMIHSNLSVNQHRNSLCMLLRTFGGYTLIEVYNLSDIASLPLRYRLPI